MKKRIICLILTCLMLLPALPALAPSARAASYMSNKTEIPVDLEVSGAEALCQTADGYVWIAQYSGLTRYDASDFQSYKDFEYDGQTYPIINARSLAAEDVIENSGFSRTEVSGKNGDRDFPIFLI